MDDEDRFLELDREDFELLEELPVCGCGIPETVYGLYHAVLRCTTPAPDPNAVLTLDDLKLPPMDVMVARAREKQAERLAAAEGNETLWYVVAYVLDHIEATEHGGNIAGAWRTPKGERLLAVLDRFAELGYGAIPTYAANHSKEAE